MMNQQLVQDWMTADPITIAGTEKMIAAYELMEGARIRHLPVMLTADSRRVVGFVTKSELRQAELETAVLYSQSEIRTLASSLKTVAEVMTTPFPFVSSQDPVARAARLMLDHKLTGLPVIDGDHLVGVITESDIFRCLLMREAVQNGR